MLRVITITPTTFCACTSYSLIVPHIFLTFPILSDYECPSESVLTLLLGLAGVATLFVSLTDLGCLLSPAERV